MIKKNITETTKNGKQENTKELKKFNRIAIDILMKNKKSIKL